MPHHCRCRSSPFFACRRPRNKTIFFPCKCGKRSQNSDVSTVSGTLTPFGTATIGSTVGALTLGTPIFDGLAANKLPFVIQGAVLVALFAILTDMAIDAEQIDEAKVEEARQRAAARLLEKLSSEEVAAVNASLARSLAQLNVKRRRHS